ncbi:MAG: S8 family serine peptidase, partial [Sarcina sp.]
RVIDRLLEFPEVEYIDFDIYAHLCGMSISSANGIHFPNKNKLSGKGVGIGLIDSGVYPHHDLIIPNNKIKYFLDIINNIKYPYDDYGHGTFIAGILCGSGASSDGLYKGIAEKSSLYSIKAFNSTGKGFISDVLKSLEILINISEENNIKVFCLPFEVLEHNSFALSLFHTIFEKAVQKNITVVVPSGSNPSQNSCLTGISTLKNCLTIGGINTFKTLKKYDFSPYGSINKTIKPDFIASCVNICSLNTDPFFISEKNGLKLYPKKLIDPYITFTGTSCSAAYVAGLCALLYENNPKLCFKDILSLLKLACESKGLDNNVEGNGFIDVKKLF